MRRCLPWIALLFAGVAGAQQEPQQPSDVVVACAARADAGQIGLNALEQDCADLRAALESLGVRSLIATSSQERLSRESLPQLLALVRPKRSAAPGLSTLAAALPASIDSQKPESWWRRLLAWLQQRLPGEDESRAGWLEEWLSRLTPGQAAIRVTFYAVLAALVVGACVIVFNELHAAGLFGSRPAVSPRRRPGAESDETTLSLARVQAAPAAQRPVLLFQLLVAALVRVGRAPADRSLTHRELASRVLLTDAVQRGVWGRLATLAERQLYSSAPVPVAELERVLVDAETLYATVQNTGGDHV